MSYHGALAPRDYSRAADWAAAVIEGIATAAMPGDLLGTKAKLREKTGVSAGTFNEALRILQSRGVVFVRSGPGGGLFAAEQSPMIRLGNSVLALDANATSVAEAVRIRDALDPLVMADALRHASPADIEVMRKTLSEMEVSAKSANAREFVHLNWSLHKQMAAVGPNGVLSSIYCGLLELIESHTLDVLPHREQPLPEYLLERYELHSSMVDSIEDRDIDAAIRLVSEHNTTTRVLHT